MWCFKKSLNVATISCKEVSFIIIHCDCCHFNQRLTVAAFTNRYHLGLPPYIHKIYTISFQLNARYIQSKTQWSCESQSKQLNKNAGGYFYKYVVVVLHFLNSYWSKVVSIQCSLVLTFIPIKTTMVDWSSLDCWSVWIFPSIENHDWVGICAREDRRPDITLKSNLNFDWSLSVVILHSSP